MKIYADVLIVTSCITEFIYLQTASALMHRKLSRGRAFAACLFGGSLSLLIIADGGTFVGALLITAAKALGLIITLLIGIRVNGFGDLIKCLIVFLLVRAAFTGLVVIYWELSDTKRIFVRNYTTYFDISLLKLACAMITMYFMLTAAEKIKLRAVRKNARYTAIYRCGDYEVSLPALADTGNKLCDCFTGLPIVIFCCDDMYRYYSLEDTVTCSRAGFRLIPYSTINGSGLISVTSKGNVTITDDHGRRYAVRCCVGIRPSGKADNKAIFDPVLLE